MDIRGALHFGVDAAKLAAVRDYKESPLFNAAERTAFDLAVAASSGPNAVTDETFRAPRNHWSEEQITELVGVIAVAGLARSRAFLRRRKEGTQGAVKRVAAILNSASSYQP